MRFRHLRPDINRISSKMFEPGSVGPGLQGILRDISYEQAHNEALMDMFIEESADFFENALEQTGGWRDDMYEDY